MESEMPMRVFGAIRVPQEYSAVGPVAQND